MWEAGFPWPPQDRWSGATGGRKLYFGVASSRPFLPSPSLEPHGDGEPCWDRDARGNGRPVPPVADVPQPTAQLPRPTAEPPRAGRDGTNGRCLGGGRWNPRPSGRTRAQPAVGGRPASVQPPERTRRCPGCAGASRDPARPDRLSRPGGSPSRHRWLEFSLCRGRSCSYSFPRSQSLPLPEAYLRTLLVRVQ